MFVIARICTVEKQNLSEHSTIVAVYRTQGEEGLYSCEFHDTNASCIEKWNFTRANMMECPETGAKGYNCHGSCDSCSGRVELAESLGIQASGHCLMGITIDQETGLTTSDWNDGSTMWYSPGFCK